ncbi:MAG: hypothetical protein GX100_07155 [candidate division WS1 bacterium]|jgi:hypothetical protein|nr:hypothetical protein [candidate division WS1 bacterium]
MSRITSVLLTILVLLGAMGVQAEVPPVLTLHLAPYFAAGPVIDGKLDDAAWRTAPENSTFYKYWTTAAEATPLRTAFRLGYDAKGLFLGANMYEKEPDKIKATIAQRQDPRLWTDDCAEIYVDSAGSGTGYRKFTINALGTTQTLYRMDMANSDPTWAPEGWQAAAVRDAEGWTFEMYIPWEILGRPAEAGDLWKLCFVRFSWSSGGWAGGGLVTSALGGNYNNPDRFGWLLFLPRDAGGDTNALAQTIAERVPGDWLVSLPEAVVMKSSGEVKATSMKDLVASLRTEVQAELEDCRQLSEGDSVAATGLDAVDKELAGVPAQVADAVGFQLAMGTLAKISSKIEDIRYTHMLTALLAAG